MATVRETLIQALVDHGFDEREIPLKTDEELADLVIATWKDDVRRLTADALNARNKVLEEIQKDIKELIRP